MANANGKTPNFDFITARKPIITGLGATYTLKENESGSTVVLNRAAGTVLTLPLAVPGLVYDVNITTTVTSNSYKVITGAATEFLIGGYTNVDTDTSNAVAVFTGNGSTHIAVTMNGGTTGGLLGTTLRFTCLSATRWQVEGMMMGSGVVATAFATS
jgi:hypothetical protein